MIESEKKKKTGILCPNGVAMIAILNSCAITDLEGLIVLTSVEAEGRWVGGTFVTPVTLSASAIEDVDRLLIPDGVMLSSEMRNKALALGIVIVYGWRKVGKILVDCYAEPMELY